MFGGKQQKIVIRFTLFVCSKRYLIVSVFSMSNETRKISTANSKEKTVKFAMLLIWFAVLVSAISMTATEAQKKTARKKNDSPAKTRKSVSGKEITETFRETSGAGHGSEFTQC